MTATTRIPGRRLLHSPGPTTVPDEVLDAMHRQPMDLADPRVNAAIDACEQGLRWLVGSPGAAIIQYATNGHGVWEAVIENLLPVGAAALIPGTGHFSDSWALQVDTTGRRAVRTPWREGHAIDVVAVQQVLTNDVSHDIVAVFAVHTDTASGVTSDIDALRRALDACGHPALLVVDAVASLGAAPLAMDAQRFDVLVGASQKGLMCPPGLGFVAVNERALAVAGANPAPRFYWDWARRHGPQSYSKFCGTPPLPLVFGLAASLKLLADEGLRAVFKRHQTLAGAVHAAVQGWSEGGAVSFFCQDEAARSVSVTAIALAEGFDPEALRTLARERFDVGMAGGLGPLYGRVFRIGHLGDLNAAMVLGCLAGVEAALLVQGVPHGPGTRRAIEFLAAND